MRRRWIATGGLWVAVAAVSLAGCKKMITVPPLECVAACYRPLTTPAAPLYNLALAYAEKGSNASTQYATLLDPALFTFRYYDPQSSDPTVRKFWNSACR